MSKDFRGGSSAHQCTSCGQSFPVGKDSGDRRLVANLKLYEAWYCEPTRYTLKWCEPCTNHLLVRLMEGVNSDDKRNTST